MVHLPITRMTLYKHGVGFFERRAAVSTDSVALSFREKDMNDVLKSLTVVDGGAGQVLGIDYPTPKSREERLAGCSIALDDARSLQDLLVSLRGRRVALHLDQDQTVTGTLLGLDAPPEREPLATTLVSLLQDGTGRVEALTLARVQGVEILDDQGLEDLRFFLRTALSQEAYRSVTLRLSPGDHDLSVAYLAPAPTWRVSYRLVAEPEGEVEDGEAATGRALLQGWGIFDNTLEEDLEAVALSLVAGMPISFVYDLVTPFTPERPVVEEEGRVAAAPVAFDLLGPLRGGAAEAAPPAPAAAVRMAAMAKREARFDIDTVAEAAAVETTGEALGELFQVTIATPVTVGRGQSAMVPILQSRLAYTKDLIYNGRKLPAHPVATLRLDNATGLALERGPVTVIEQGAYVGEALLPFTVVGGKLTVPYAVELGIKLREESATARELRGLELKGAYLQFEEWDIRRTEYRIDNTTAQPARVLIEHPRTAHYELFDTPAPVETGGEHVHFAVRVPGQTEVVHRVQERRLIRRREEVRRQSYAGLQRYLQQGLLKRADLDALTRLLELWEAIADHERRLTELQQERDRIYKAQQQIQGNMQALGQAGKEGALRTRYVEQLEATEGQLRTLDKQESDARAEIERLQHEIDTRLQQMG